jgi:hypothetical protein
VPAGVGSNLPILISTGLGLSQDNPNFRLGYAPPGITSIVDTAAPALSFTSLNPATQLQLNGVPTLGRLVTIVGTNLGTAELVTSTPLLAVPGTFNLSVTVTGTAGSGFLKDAVVVSHDHESIVILFPAGQGTDLTVAVSVGAQTDTDVLGGAARAPTLVRYLAPSISLVYNPSTGAQLDSTVGGSTLCLAGANFGTAGAGDVEAAGKPVVSVGGLPAPLVAGYLASAGHSLVCTVLPEGWGANLPVSVTVAGQTSAVAANASYTYAPPSVFSISPASGPTSGLVAAGGAPINVTVRGANLGRAGFAVFMPTMLGSSQVNVTVPPAARSRTTTPQWSLPCPSALATTWPSRR